MYKPPKREDPASLLKVKLPATDGVPPRSVVKAQLEECQTKKGMQIEQAWTTSKPSQKFILIAQLQEGKKQPVWTLYEENESGSKMHWSQPFEAEDLEMMYDVICMSAPDTGRSAGIPEQLKPGANDKKSGPVAARSATGLPAAMPPSMGASAYPSPAGAGASAYPTPTSGSGYPSPASGSAYPAPAAGSGYPSPAGAAGYSAPAPGSGYPSPASAPTHAQAPYPAPAYPPPQPQQYAPGNYQGGYQQYPPGQQPYPQQPYPGAQQPWPAPGYPPAGQMPYPGQAPQVASNNTGYAPPQSYASQFEQAAAGSSLADYGLITHKSNILLGELIREAGLITEPTLEAALKIQEFVREERMSQTQACEILKKHHALGASIDNYLTPEDFDLAGQTVAKKSTASPKPSTSGNSKAPSGAAKTSSKESGSSDSTPELPRAEKIKLQLASFDLLQKAGLLKGDDLQAAHAVYKKHGGDIVQMLTAAGKMDATTYKAAEVCIPLIHDNKMKVEQCIIALNYCQRSRVDFDSALDELGWENPRRS